MAELVMRVLHLTLVLVLLAMQAPTVNSFPQLVHPTLVVPMVSAMILEDLTLAHAMQVLLVQTVL